MARAMVGRSGSTGSLNECARCGGLLVSDFCMDLLSSTGELEFAARRCVQCGEVVDPVIQRNRSLGQEPMTAGVSKRMAYLAEWP